MKYYSFANQLRQQKQYPILLPLTMNDQPDV